MNNDIEILKEKIEEKKRENLELIQYFQNEMENINQENERLNESQERRVEEFQKHYNEFDKIFKFISNEIQEAEYSINLKEKEISEIHQKNEELQLKEREHFDYLYNLYLEKEKEIQKIEEEKAKEQSKQVFKSKIKQIKNEADEIEEGNDQSNQEYEEKEENEELDENYGNEEQKDIENQQSQQSLQSQQISQSQETSKLKEEIENKNEIELNNITFSSLEMDFVTLIIKLKFLLEDITAETLIYNAIENDIGISYTRMSERCLSLINNTNKNNIKILAKYFEILSENSFNLSKMKKNFGLALENMTIDFLEFDNDYRKKLIMVTSPKKDLIEQKMHEKDLYNSNIITFSDYISILEEIELSLDDSILFYTVYLMKKKNCIVNKNYLKNLGIFELFYNNLLDVITHKINYIDIHQIMKLIQIRCKKIDVNEFFSPLNKKIKSIGDQKYFMINDLDIFLKDTNILKENEEINKDNFSEMINAEFIINAIKIENENEQSLLDNDNNEDEIIESNRKNSIDQKANNFVDDVFRNVLFQIKKE